MVCFVKNQYLMQGHVKHNHGVSDAVQCLDKLTFDILICIVFFQFYHWSEFKTHFIAIAKKKTLAS